MRIEEAETRQRDAANSDARPAAEASLKQEKSNLEMWTDQAQKCRVEQIESENQVRDGQARMAELSGSTGSIRQTLGSVPRQIILKQPLAFAPSSRAEIGDAREDVKKARGFSDPPPGSSFNGQSNETPLPRRGLGLSLNDKRDEGLGTPLVLGIFLGKRLHHEAFFGPGAEHTVDRHSHENRQPDRADHETRS